MKNFLDWFDKNVVIFKEEDYKERMTASVEVFNFFKQEFEPSLLPKLFEGWHKVKDFNEVYAFNYKKDESILNAEHTILFSSEFKTIIIKHQTYKLPKTLDSFMTLVEEQTDIKLKFKQEIIDKYEKRN